MKSRVAALVAVLAATVVTAGTRFPAEDGTVAAATLGLAALGGLAAILSTIRRRAKFLKAVVVVVLGTQLLLPVSGQAMLQDAPAWLVAASAVMALHLFLLEPRASAPPRLSSPSLALRLLRVIPTFVALALVVSLPIAYSRVLPDRVRLAYELNTALAPLMAAVLVASALLLMALFRQLTRRRRSPKAVVDEGPSHPVGGDVA